MGESMLPETVEIEYHFKNSVHVFTCRNEAGVVHIDSADRKEAYDRIGPVLSQHFTAFCGHAVRYVPVVDYRGFTDVVAGRKKAAVQNISFHLEETRTYC